MPQSAVTFVPVSPKLLPQVPQSSIKMHQAIRYLRTKDGVQLAWTTLGSGPPLIKAANWLTHLQHDLESPVWKHWIRFLARHFRFTRYDERGCGMTQWEVPDVSLARWVDDLDDVIEIAEPTGKVALLGISQGAATCIGYAVRHPERVSHLILYGGYATGWKHRGDPEGLRRYEAIVELARLEWGSDNAAFRQIFTSRFVPGASPEQLDWFNDLCKRTTKPAIAAHLMSARSEVDVRELLERVRVPTLVVHAVGDEVTPIKSSRELAAGIPGAEFVLLDSRNHVLLEHEPAWTRFKDVVLEFTGRDTRARDADESFGALSARERDVLIGLVAGRTNAEIAAELHLSEKTVRNIVSRIYDKLNVRTRAQAIVLARDHQFHS